jgi:hypothetical protein
MALIKSGELWVFSAGAVAPPLQEALRLFEKVLKSPKNNKM